MFIHADECIDCGACEPECPVDAIRMEDEADEKWLEINAKLSEAHG
jgi:ferredoxin